MDTPPPPPVGEDSGTSRDERMAAVVALKTLPAAKSRLSRLPDPVRERLARCMALDTLAALRPAVHEIVVVSDQPDLAAALRRHGLDVRVIPEPGPAAATAQDVRRGPLNSALAAADGMLRTEGVEVVLASVGDLPALRASSVARVITASRPWPRSFLSDHAGQGTTMLVARGVPLDPLYGTENPMGAEVGLSVGSAERHRRSGAVALPVGALPDARRDVDEPEDLAAAARLGVGAATAQLLDPSGQLGRYTTPEVLRVDADLITVLVDGVVETCARQTGSGWTYDGDPALLVPGRRLHAVRVADDLRCWS